MRQRGNRHDKASRPRMQANSQSALTKNIRWWPGHRGRWNRLRRSL